MFVLPNKTEYSRNDVHENAAFIVNFSPHLEVYGFKVKFIITEEG